MVLSSPIQQEQQLDFREFRSFTRALSQISWRTSGLTRIAKIAGMQAVLAAKEGQN